MYWAEAGAAMNKSNSRGRKKRYRHLIECVLRHGKQVPIRTTTHASPTENRGQHPHRARRRAAPNPGAGAPEQRLRSGRPWLGGKPAVLLPAERGVLVDPSSQGEVVGARSLKNRNII